MSDFAAKLNELGSPDIDLARRSSAVMKLEREKRKLAEHILRLETEERVLCEHIVEQNKIIAELKARLGE